MRVRLNLLLLLSIVSGVSLGQQCEKFPVKGAWIRLKDQMENLTV
jgi:hypothetical protein